MDGWFSQSYFVRIFRIHVLKDKYSRLQKNESDKIHQKLWITKRNQLWNKLLCYFVWFLRKKRNLFEYFKELRSSKNRKKIFWVNLLLCLAKKKKEKSCFILGPKSKAKKEHKESFRMIWQLRVEFQSFWEGKP